MTIILRPATPDDLDALAKLAVDSYRLGFEGIMDHVQFALRDEGYFRLRFSTEWPSIHLAEDRFGRCLGFIEVRDGTLDMIFMRDEAQGSGLAQRLLRHAESLGATRLECFRDNHRARRFYEREGWVLAGTETRDFAGRMMHFVHYALGAEAQRSTKAFSIT